MFGYTSEAEILTSKAENLYANASDRDNLLSKLESEGKTIALEMLLKRRDNTLFWGTVSARQVKDADGNFVFLDGAIEDISPRKTAESERRKLEEQLIHAQRMESIGRLAGGIAHDFNNILTSIMGYAELLNEKLDKGKPQEKKALSVIIDGVERAANLTKQLLGFARKGKYQPVPLEVNDSIKHVLKVSDKIFEKNIIVKLNLMNVPNIIADKSQIDQILTNLFINAKDAMPEGGELSVNTKEVYLNENSLEDFPDLIPGSHVVVTVSDNGIGMSKDTIKHIFEPFYTTKMEGKGTGLGLATVYGIVKNHNGHINVYSEPGLGTSFTLYFPTTKKSVEDEKIDNSVIRGEGRILVIDDEEHIRSIIESQLNELGYQVDTAENGKDGLKVFEKFKDKIDLVLIDMIMPVLGGKETFIEMRKTAPDVKVVLMSGFSRSGKAEEILAEDNVSFIQKPFRIQDLSKVISDVLKR
jgi:signal transduction histidine kinase/CheY-like chemotaxis protein